MNTDDILYSFVPDTNNPANPLIVTSYKGESVVSACLWSMKKGRLESGTEYLQNIISAVVQTISTVFPDAIFSTLLPTVETSSQFRLKRVKIIMDKRFSDAYFNYVFQVPVGTDIQQYFSIGVKVDECKNFASFI